MGLRSLGKRPRQTHSSSSKKNGFRGRRGISFLVTAALLTLAWTHLAHSDSSHPSSEMVFEDDEGPPLPDERAGGGNEDTPKGIPTEYQDFSLGVLPSSVVSHMGSPTEVMIETDEYNLTVDWSQQGWVDYRIAPDFTTDSVRYRRVNPTYPGKGTIDEFGNPLNGVNMTITSWGLAGNVASFVEACQEFSLNQTFTFFRDYMELNVTYIPGTKNVLTTYFIGLYSASEKMHNMFDGGYHRYMPGADEELPKSHRMGGWYPRYTMFAPAVDMRVPQGNMGVEWGYNDTVGYLSSPIWMKDYGGGASAFSLKYSSINSIVPNIGLGSPETFHMFIRPYQYDDGKDRGYDVGYAQWVTKKIVDEWGYHDTPVFPLTVMNVGGGWSAEFKNWVESSQVKVATYTQNSDQIDWNYGSAWQRNQEPRDDPSLIPDDWELWGPGNQPQFGGGDVILNPVSGTYEDVGSFRHHLIEDNPYNGWWWGSDAVFWDEMNVWTPDVRPRNDYHNRSEFLYEGYLKLVQESYQSGHWDFVIANPFTALLHLSMVSDLTVVESYRPSSTYGADFAGHVHSTMLFVNNIPVQFRPDILVYQYYDTGNPDDQEDIYRLLMNSAQYRFHIAPVAWRNQSAQILNLEMAEKMYLAMGASRDEGIQIQAETLDLDVESSVSTSSRVVVWTGDDHTPNIKFTSREESYNFTNLRSGDTPFGASIDTSEYYSPMSSSIEGHMTYFPDGEAWFNGTIEAEETDYILRLDSFQVRQIGGGQATVQAVDFAKTDVKFTLTSSGGDTEFTIGGLLPEAQYATYLDGSKHDILVSNVSGFVSFTISPGDYQTVHLMLDTGAPFTEMSFDQPYYADGASTYVTNSTSFTLIPHSYNDGEINDTRYRIWGFGQWSTWYSYSNPFTIAQMDGDVFIEYFSTDTEGGIEPTRNFTCIVDNSSPTTDLSVGYPKFGSKPIFVSGWTNISLDAVDGGSGLLVSWYEIDSEPVSPYLAPFNLSSYQGMHLLGFGSVDNVGNNESAQEIWVFVDDEPPTSTIHIGEPSSLHNGTVYVNSSTQFTVTVSDEGSGGGQAWYKIDDGNWTVADEGFTIQAEGLHRVYYNSTDNVSNPEETTSIDVFIDNEPPVAQSCQNLDVERGSTFTLDASLSTDNALIVNYTWSSDGILLFGVNPSLAIDGTGSHLVVLTVRDILGNEDTDALWVNVSDTTPPSPPTGLTAEPGQRGEINLAWDPNQENDMAGYFVYRSTSPKGPFTKITAEIVPHAHYKDTGLPDGKTFYYVVTAVDASGNECVYSSPGMSGTITPPSSGFIEDWWWVIASLAGSITFVSAIFLVRRRREQVGTESSRKSK